jgi:cobalt/nickel transport system permease protein
MSLEDLQKTDSPVHRFNPSLKIIALFILAFSFSTVQHGGTIPFMLGISLFLLLASHIPISFVLVKMKISIWVVGLICMVVLFFTQGRILFHWGILSVTHEGLFAALLICSRFLAIVTLMIVLFGTTSFLTIVKALRVLKVSPILIDMCLFTYRYLFTLQGQFQSMYTATNLRGFRPQNWRNWKTLSSLVGALFVRSFDQSDRVYQAMRLRGYGHDPKPFQEKSLYKRTELISFALIILMSMTIFTVSWGL